VHFVGRDDWTAMDEGRHTIVIIETRSGKRFEEESWFRLMDQAQLERKFHELVEPLFGAERTARVQSLLQGVETASSIRQLLRELRG